MDLWVCHLGRVEYRRALALQHALRERRQAGEIPDTLLLLEHDPVYTRGRRSGPEELPVDVGIPVVDVDRGGKVTYHGPGQLVGYPIAEVTDVKGFVHTLERALVAALAQEGVPARTREDEGVAFTGVWVEDRKIASLGVHVQKGVTTHGFAVNVDGDLAPWGWIVPCGLPDVRMTSLQAETGAADLACLRKRVAHEVAQALGRRQRLVSRHRVESAALVHGAVRSVDHRPQPAPAEAAR